MFSSRAGCIKDAHKQGDSNIAKEKSLFGPSQCLSRLQSGQSQHIRIFLLQIKTFSFRTALASVNLNVCWIHYLLELRAYQTGSVAYSAIWRLNVHVITLIGTRRMIHRRSCTKTRCSASLATPVKIVFNGIYPSTLVTLKCAHMSCEREKSSS